MAPVANERHVVTSSAWQIPLPPQPHQKTLVQPTSARPTAVLVRLCTAQNPFYSIHRPSSDKQAHISRQTTQKQRLVLHSCMCKSPAVRSDSAPVPIPCPSHRKMEDTISPSLQHPSCPFLQWIDTNLCVCSKFSNPKSTKI